MIKFGLVSVSFRNLSCEEIIKSTKNAGLDGIEWGGDIHVPHGDCEKARYISHLTEKNGLKISAYGSYYKAGTYLDYMKEFNIVLNTADVLKAPVIRIWAGNLSSEKTDEILRKKICDECAEISAAAKEKNIMISFECHRNTLTDTADSSVRLMNEISGGNISMFWQPNEEKSCEYNLSALKKILPYLTNIHVFNWPEPDVRLPLKNAENEWKNYLSLINCDKRNHWCSLEFMPDNKPESLIAEANTLKSFLL